MAPCAICIAKGPTQYLNWRVLKLTLFPTKDQR